MTAKDERDVLERDRGTVLGFWGWQSCPAQPEASGTSITRLPRSPKTEGGPRGKGR